MGDVVAVVGTVEVLPIPATITMSGSTSHQAAAPLPTHMGKMMLDRMPPAHGCFGRWSVSYLGSKHGEYMLPPKLSFVKQR